MGQPRPGHARPSRPPARADDARRRRATPHGALLQHSKPRRPGAPPARDAPGPPPDRKRADAGIPADALPQPALPRSAPELRDLLPPLRLARRMMIVPS